jgi:CheY-like chemotaxis protein
MPMPKMIEDGAVLVVDDDPDTREVLSELLDASGLKVLQAENGKIALEVLRKTPRFPRLVLLDLSMPVLDGRGFLERRAQDPLLRDIPVVVISASNQSAEKLEGIEEFLRKPVKVERLMEIIDHYR